MNATVPTVDLADYDRPPRARSAMLQHLDETCRSVGFLSVVGHGIDPVLIARMQAVTTSFFDLPVEEKMPYVCPPDVNRGYSPPGAEALSYSLGVETPPDLFQAFNAGVQIHTVDPSTRPEHHAGLYADNVWPDPPAEMQEVWEEYLTAVADLSQRMLRVLASALELDEEFFSSRADQAPDVVRALDYRSFGEAAPAPGQMGLGAHSDYGMCTMLYADPVPGLQIMSQEGTWRDVMPTPGAYLVNIGDMLAAWTNDRWSSTLHRVLPPSGRGAVHRRSVAYFHEANPDAVIDPLPSCIDADNPPRYEPISAGDHLYNKIVSPRSMTVTTAVQTTGDRAESAVRPLTN